MSTSPPKKILITGASGYVGQHLTASIGFLGLKDNDNNKGRRYQLYCTYHSLETYEEDLKLIFDENQRLLHPSIVSITPIQINFSDTTTSSKDTYVQKIRQFCGTDRWHRCHSALRGFVKSKILRRTPEGGMVSELPHWTIRIRRTYHLFVHR